MKVCWVEEGARAEVRRGGHDAFEEMRANRCNRDGSEIMDHKRSHKT